MGRMEQMDKSEESKAESGINFMDEAIMKALFPEPPKDTVYLLNPKYVNGLIRGKQEKL